MTGPSALRVTAGLGFLAVALGAFGAHALKDLLDNKAAAIWEKAVFYQFIHTVVMLLLAVRSPFRRGPWLSFLVGIVFFSGSLYILALTGAKWWGAVTPVGGLAFLVGWLWLAVAPVPLPVKDRS
jgi:uncharacterized membrane protein YgdD (TMEM256/DUF423 family)